MIIRGNRLAGITIEKYVYRLNSRSHLFRARQRERCNFVNLSVWRDNYRASGKADPRDYRE